jgi:hypothetical protein
MRHNHLPRVINLLLGTWLCISAFVWPHTFWGQTNTWLCGVFCVVFAFVALGLPRARLVNTLLAGWLFVSSWLIVGTATGTKWNNAMVAIAVFILSLVEAPPTPRNPTKVPSGSLIQAERSAK